MYMVNFLFWCKKGFIIMIVVREVIRVKGVFWMGEDGDGIFVLW